MRIFLQFSWSSGRKATLVTTATLLLFQLHYMIALSGFTLSDSMAQTEHGIFEMDD
jgi:hypothetical protein